VSQWSGTWRCTGQVEAPARDLLPTQYRIDLAASALLLPVTG
jgi:hypothetical protein